MKLKVYYIDDEPELLEIFAETFARPEIEISTFLDPENAVVAINKNPPDLIFVDYRLPKISGDLLAFNLDPNIPKVLLTGEMSINCKTKFLALFEKPFQTEKIEKFIDSFVKDHKSAL